MEQIRKIVTAVLANYQVESRVLYDNIVEAILAMEELPQADTGGYRLRSGDSLCTGRANLERIEGYRSQEEVVVQVAGTEFHSLPEKRLLEALKGKTAHAV